MNETPFQQVMKELALIKDAITAPKRPSRSLEINEFMKAFIALKHDMVPVTKDGYNKSFNHKYCTLENILEMTEPLLLKHEFVIIDTVEHGGEYGIFVCTMTHVPSMQYMESRTPVITERKHPHGVAGCKTYYARYMRMAMLGIMREDDDAESCSKE